MSITAAAEHPTLGEVAPLAGVSTATASRVLNNSARVSNAARQQVREAVIRLGYVRQRAARAVDRRPRSVAAVVCDQPRLFADPFFARVIKGASAAFAERDVPMLLAAGTTGRRSSGTSTVDTSTGCCCSAAAAATRCRVAARRSACR